MKNDIRANEYLKKEIGAIKKTRVRGDKKMRARYQKEEYNCK